MVHLSLSECSQLQYDWADTEEWAVKMNLGRTTLHQREALPSSDELGNNGEMRRRIWKDYLNSQLNSQPRMTPSAATTAVIANHKFGSIKKHKNEPMENAMLDIMIGILVYHFTARTLPHPTTE